MIGVLIVTHLNLGEKILNIAQSILGQQQLCKAISIEFNRNSEEIISKIKEGIDEVDIGDGVIILTDMFGGTPTNLSLSLLNEKNIEVVTGINLPMILGILSSRSAPLKELALKAKSYGKQGIVVAREILEKKIPIK